MAIIRFDSILGALIAYIYMFTNIFLALIRNLIIEKI